MHAVQWAHVWRSAGAHARSHVQHCARTATGRRRLVPAHGWAPLRAQSMSLRGHALPLPFSDLAIEPGQIWTAGGQLHVLTHAPGTPPGTRATRRAAWYRCASPVPGQMRKRLLQRFRIFDNLVCPVKLQICSRFLFEDFQVVRQSAKHRCPKVHFQRRPV